MKKSCHSHWNEKQTRLACDVNKISSEKQACNASASYPLDVLGMYAILQSFRILIRGFTLQCWNSPRFWPLAWAVYLHVIRHNHILTCRSSQILTFFDRILMVSFFSFSEQHCKTGNVWLSFIILDNVPVNSVFVDFLRKLWNPKWWT